MKIIKGSIRFDIYYNLPSLLLDSHSLANEKSLFFAMLMLRQASRPICGVEAQDYIERK